ncbi:hypothetical protein BV25DRAFT_960899 [Artomyces pyxidatus]|uniref:Uncharacterized protein n=1 Tax=Artomyces pyxidatus TaxID=48021 RepID=A0ACB8SVD1_9AGAM|nr:hypothetical protein BV25DRAFT_960899 [Artomyces pyxidatus]
MFAKSKLTFPSPMAILSVMAVINAAILIGTVHRLFSAEPAVLYSNLDKDIPLELPIGPISTVEMTFQESARFTLSDNDSKPNWETLFTNQFGLGFTHLPPYYFRTIAGAYHSLHCVYSLQEDFDKPDHAHNPSHHAIHCLMYMRQIFQCYADGTLEEGDFMTRNLTLDRIGDTRQCRDWSKVAAWTDQNFKEWSDYNGVVWD